MKYIDREFEKEYEEGANFVAEFVRKMCDDRIFEIGMQEFEILPKDLEQTARLNMWKRVQNDLVQSLEYIKSSGFDYHFTVSTIIDEVKRMVNNKNISDKKDEIFTWIIFYTMALFIKDERLKHYRRKPDVEIDRNKDCKEQIFSDLVLGEEYSDQMCNYLGVYEAAKLLKMNYLIPIVEISTSVTVWAHIQLLTDDTNNEIKLPELPDKLNTEYAKKMFSKAVKAGLMYPLSEGKGYQWEKSNVLLAYFCGKIYCGDGLARDEVTKEWKVKRGIELFPETDLMSFFVNRDRQAIKNLGQSRLQMINPPNGYKDIDKLFDEAI